MQRNECVWILYWLWEIFSQVPLLDLMYYIIWFKSGPSGLYICLVKMNGLHPCCVIFTSFHVILITQTCTTFQFSKGFSAQWYFGFCVPDIHASILPWPIILPVVAASWDVGVGLAASCARDTLACVLHWEISFPRERCCVVSSQLSSQSVAKGPGACLALVRTVRKSYCRSSATLRDRLVINSETALQLGNLSRTNIFYCSRTPTEHLRVVIAETHVEKQEKNPTLCCPVLLHRFSFSLS